MLFKSGICVINIPAAGNLQLIDALTAAGHEPVPINYKAKEVSRVQMMTGGRQRTFPYVALQEYYGAAFTEARKVSIVRNTWDWAIALWQWQRQIGKIDKNRDLKSFLPTLYRYPEQIEWLRDSQGRVKVDVYPYGHLGVLRRDLGLPDFPDDPFPLTVPAHTIDPHEIEILGQTFHFDRYAFGFKKPEKGRVQALAEGENSLSAKKI